MEVSRLNNQILCKMTKIKTRYVEIEKQIACIKC